MTRLSKIVFYQHTNSGRRDIQTTHHATRLVRPTDAFTIAYTLCLRVRCCTECVHYRKRLCATRSTFNLLNPIRNKNKLVIYVGSGGASVTDGRGLST